MTHLQKHTHSCKHTILSSNERILTYRSLLSEAKKNSEIETSTKKTNVYGLWTITHVKIYIKRERCMEECVFFWLEKRWTRSCTLSVKIIQCSFLRSFPLQIRNYSIEAHLHCVEVELRHREYNQFEKKAWPTLDFCLCARWKRQRTTIGSTTQRVWW